MEMLLVFQVLVIDMMMRLDEKPRGIREVSRTNFLRITNVCILSIHAKDFAR